GLARDDGRGGQVLHPVQEAFRECHALQCGFCTPGFLMTIKAGLENRDTAAEITEEEVDELVGVLTERTLASAAAEAVGRAA
ncbi:MAG: hypothetical protein JF630_01610, partial [Geodermatophilales bacterium]|nr:hypothetical protein [Geodermatophilales bacterium]